MAKLVAVMRLITDINKANHLLQSYRGAEENLSDGLVATAILIMIAQAQACLCY